MKGLTHCHLQLIAGLEVLILIAAYIMATPTMLVYLAPNVIHHRQKHIHTRCINRVYQGKLINCIPIAVLCKLFST